MNKKIVVILLLTLLSTTFSFGQNCKYESYNNNVELARKEYSAQNFKEANKLFRIAFESVDFPFGADLRMALKVAKNTGDKVWMEQIAIRLAKGGIPLKFFKKYENQKWYKSFYEQFPEYEKFYTTNFNPEFRKKLFELAKSDAEANGHFHEWRTKKQEHSIDALINEMTAVSVGFQKMVEEYSFPTEKKTGYNYDKSEVYELPTFVILVHIYQRGELLYKEQLQELMCDGALTSSQIKQLENIKGFGNSTGITQEMHAREKQFRKKE